MPNTFPLVGRNPRKWRRSSRLAESRAKRCSLGRNPQRCSCGPPATSHKRLQAACLSVLVASLSGLHVLQSFDGTHVLRPFEGSRIGTAKLAHAALHLLHRFVFVLFHPLTDP